jgi:tripartite-type tricarboxylate transporter receptor subunit TctC
MTRSLISLVLAAVLSAYAACATAQSHSTSSGQAYPVKPVRVVTPFPAGSGPETALRLIGDKLSRAWGQQLIVENRPGGNGFIALEAAKRAAPDGYTLVQMDTALLTAHPHLYKKLPYDPVKDFDPITPLFRNYFFVVVPADSKWKDMGDLIAAAKTRHGELAYGSWFIGSPGHLGAALLEATTGTQMTHIPFKDMMQLYAAVGNGDVAWAFGSVASAGAAYRAGKVKFLAAAAPKRIAGYGSIATVGESGGPEGFEVKAWVGVFAPHGTPGSVVARVNRDVATALAEPDIRERFVGFGYEPFPAAPSEMSGLVEAESRRFGEIIRRSKISLD